jgi:uncharacterized membrane protein
VEILKMDKKHLHTAVIQHRHKLFLLGLLITASLISVGLEMIHTRIGERHTYTFLVWNLFLAWIPFGAALFAYFVRQFRKLFYIVMPVCTLFWLAFFPNAPYLLTDFQHLATRHSNAPLWYDVIMLIWFAWTGLLLGISSLYLMQEIITDKFNPSIGWVFTISAVIASSIGVYLGRFLRWNSWDLLADPIPIAKEMVAIVQNPLANLPTYIFTILFTLLTLFIYLTIHLFSSIIKDRTERF